MPSMLRVVLSVLLLLVPAFAQAPAPPTPREPIPVLVVTGANNHDWEWTARSLASMLEEAGRFAVDTTTDPRTTLADAGALAKYRAVVLDYNGPRWGDEAERVFLAAVSSGLGVAVVHAANNAFPGWVEYEKLVGHCWREGTGHGRFHPFDVAITDREHPLTRDMPDLRAHPDELYHRLVHMHGVEHRVLATALSSTESGGTGNAEPMIVVKSYGEGRVFHTPLGHVWRGVVQSRASHADPQFRWLIARGTEWAATGDVTLPPDPPNFLTADERAAGFRLLFNGRDTDGWRGFRRESFPERGWVVAGGCLEHVANTGGGDIVTVDRFGDFELRFEWQVTPGANSGVIYRVGEDDGQTWHTGFEYQVFDDGDRPQESATSAGSLYGLAAPVGKVLRPVGEFNSARIVVAGGRLEHWLNGVRIVDIAMAGDDWDARIRASKFKAMPSFGSVARGHIALQDHGATVRFRSLRIREIATGKPGDADRDGRPGRR